jgi:hypothetical protein
VSTQKHSKERRLPDIPEMNILFASADYVDIKTTESELLLREFVARLLSYQPAWVTALYAIRWGFVRLLGMKQNGVPQAKRLNAGDVLMRKGEDSQFLTFDVIAAQEDAYWFAQASESHLNATLGVICEARPDGQNRFCVVTLVHYNRWTGRVYFNVIRLFHHLVVGAMIRHAAGDKAALKNGERA